MNVSIAMEIDEHTGFQITAGASANGATATRHLIFGVLGTNDSVRVTWDRTESFPDGGPVPLCLRVGTLPDRQAALEDWTIVAHEPAGLPLFGPDADGILRSIADVFTKLSLSADDPFEALLRGVPSTLFGEHPKLFMALASDGEIPKLAGRAADPYGVRLSEIVFQYATVGSALGKLITHDQFGAQAGLALGAVIGVPARMSE